MTNLPALKPTIEEIVNNFNKTVELYDETYGSLVAADEKLKKANEMEKRITPFRHNYFYERHNEFDKFRNALNVPTQEYYFETARRFLTLKTWAFIVEQTKLDVLMDHTAKQELKQQLSLENIDKLPEITVDNVIATIEMFAADSVNVWRRGIASVFSKLDRRFKSHDGFKIGSRIILTNAISWGDSLTGWAENYINDVNRVFCILDGKQGDIKNYGIYSLDKTEYFETEYFRFRRFRNGNLHIWMRRDDLLRLVNKELAIWYGEVVGDGNQAEEDAFKQSTAVVKNYGFFPTPTAAAKKTIENANLYSQRTEPCLDILEPSAGTGNLARLCTVMDFEHWSNAEHYKKLYHDKHNVDCIEIQPDLCEQLSKEGIYRSVRNANFLDIPPSPVYDRVVMNPPFDGQHDIDHVIHAFKFLKPGGRLVSIMSAGTEFRENKKAVAFREFVKENDGRFIQLPERSFSEVGTNVNTVIVVINK